MAKSKKTRDGLRRRRASLDKRKTLNSTDDAPKYVQYQHPENLFHIEYPAHWKIEYEDNATNIISKDREEVAVTLFKMPVHLDTRLITESDRFEEGLSAMLEKVGSVNPRPDPNIVYPCMTADKPEVGQGGQRWIVAHCDLLMCISTCFPESEQHIWRPMFERMLSSFRIKREQEGLFVRLLGYVKQKLAEQLPDVKWETEGMGLKSERMQLSLGNVFARVRNHPHSLEEYADEFVQGVVSVFATPHVGSESWEDVRGKIVPLLKSESHLLESVRQRCESALADDAIVPEVVSTPWLADLHVCYAIDTEKAFRLIHRTDLDRWEIDEEHLHRAAIDNLTAIESPELVMMSSPDREGGLAMLRPHAGAASAYVLHPRLFEFLSPRMSSDILIAIPERDALIIFGNASDMRQAIAEQVRRDFETTSNALSDRLFRLTLDGAALA